MPAPLYAGLNLSYLVDYRQWCPFKNEMRMARFFWEADDTTDAVLASRLSNERTDGYPASIPSGRRARTVMSTGSRPTGGTWVCSWDGDGTVGISNGGVLTTDTDGYLEFQRVTSGDINVNLRITATNPANPVRNIWVGEQRYYATRNAERLKPEWRDHIVQAGIRHPRFMQWQSIPETLVTHWGAGANGTKTPHSPGGVEYFTDSDYIVGVPPGGDSHAGQGSTYSSILTAAIELGAESIWLCVPHPTDEGQAAVQFVDEMIRFIVGFRHPAFNTSFTGDLWIEYGNETWNPSLGPAYNYCKARGVALNLDGVNDHEKGHSFYALRSSQVFQTALTSASTRGFTGQVRRVLSGQAAASEYPFRFRTQIGARSANPINVQADYWSPASYFAHTDWESGNPIPRIRLGDSNPWHTPAEFVALTNQQLYDECNRDLQTRVLAPVTIGNDPTFPSNPTVRGGGIAADVAFAGLRGMRVVCYEGGTNHILLPNHATWDAAGARLLAWQRTAQAGQLVFESLDAHVAAGCDGTFIFDEGTGWVYYYGCWSWYDDHRDGVAGEARYAETVRHMLQGGGNVVGFLSVLNDVVSRCQPMVGTITTPSIPGTLVNSSTVARNDPLLGLIGQPVGQCASSVTITRNAPLFGYIDQDPVVPEAWAAQSTTIARNDPVTGTVITNVVNGTLSSAMVVTCGADMTGTISTTTRFGFLGETVTITRRSSNGPAVVTGAIGTLTRNQFWLRRPGYDVLTGEDYVPHGTTIYRGQLLGWFEGRLRPWLLGDPFAGISTEYEFGTELDNHGNVVLRAYDYDVKYWARAAVAWRMDGNGITGDVVYAKNDRTFTLANNGTAPVGKLVWVARRALSAVVAFEGVTVG